MTLLKEFWASDFWAFMILNSMETVCYLLLTHRFSIHKPVHLIRNIVIVFLISTASYCISFNYNSFYLYFIVIATYLLHTHFTYNENLTMTVLISILVQIVGLLIPITLLLVGRFIFSDLGQDANTGLTINSIYLCAVLIMLFNKKLDTAVHPIYKKLPSLKITLLLCYALVLTYLFTWKLKYESIIGNYLFVLISIFILATLIIESFKNHFDKTIHEKELSVYKNYSPVIEQMVGELRRRQHDYDNQLQTLIMMPIAYKDYDSLSGAIKKHTSSMGMLRDDSLIELLRIDNLSVAGFLYYKVRQANESKININFEIFQSEIKTNANDPDIVDVLGILINNAFEAVTETCNDIQVRIGSEDNCMLIQVLNEHPRIDEKTLENMCKKGVSSKENPQSRGFGLYNVHLIVKKYKGSLNISNSDLDGKNYISVEVEI